jgi:hypothetical protein
MPRRGLEAQLYFFLNLSARTGWVLNTTPWSLYVWKTDPVPIAQEAGRVPGLVGTGAENFTLTRIQSTFVIFVHNTTGQYYPRSVAVHQQMAHLHLQ